MTEQNPIVLGWLFFAVASTMSIMSVLSWTATWHDKRRAERGGQRVAERTMHVLELLGGWPGSFLARRRFRHKTRKTSFRVLSWLCTVTHVAVVAGIAWLIMR